MSSVDVAGNVREATVTYTVAAPPPAFVPVPGGSFTVTPDGGLAFGVSSNPLGSFAWLAGPGARTGAVTGPLTFTTTGTGAGRGFGVLVGASQQNGTMVSGYTVQFDPAYDCATKSAGSRIGSLVIQRWVLVPILSPPVACTTAPVDLYPGANDAQRTAAAKADRNARYWSKPMTIEVTSCPGTVAGTTRITGKATSAGPNGQPRTITVTATVNTSSLGTAWGLRAFGDVAGTVKPVATVP